MLSFTLAHFNCSEPWLFLRFCLFFKSSMDQSSGIDRQVGVTWIGSGLKSGGNSQHGHFRRGGGKRRQWGQFTIVLANEGTQEFLIVECRVGLNCNTPFLAQKSCQTVSYSWKLSRNTKCMDDQRMVYYIKLHPHSFIKTCLNLTVLHHPFCRKTQVSRVELVTT